MADPVDNVVLREAVIAFEAAPSPQLYWEVIRLSLQNNLLFDVTGSPTPVIEDGVMAQGTTFQLRGGTAPDGRQALFAFTNQEQAQRMHSDEPVQTLGQPAPGAVDVARSQGYAWLYIDPAGPTCGINLDDVAHLTAEHRNDAVRQALTTPGDHELRAAVIAALILGGPLLVGVGEHDGVQQVRTSVDPDRGPVLLAFTSGAEIAVRNPGDAWAVRDVASVIAEALAEPFHGLVINPAGPWIGLDHDELRGIQSRLPA
jgi:hypothetical protein